jgi:hypothetical protein
VSATLTTHSTPRLSEVARHLIYPEGIVTSGWLRIRRRLAEMSIVYDGWQEGAAQLILGHDAAGRYACTVGGVTMSLPRQVGKTFTVGSLLIAMCIEYPGLRVVWTSHHGRTTTNTFRAMQGMVRRKRVQQYVAHNGIRTANGEQEIKFANGSIILFGAREHGFGVGIDAIDVLVCDEAQRLSSRALADMMPTTNQAQHEHGALVFFIGIPPRPDDKGDEFAARRNKALDGRMERGIFIELSADEDGDYDDPEQWAKANASYPHRTPHEAMLRLRENLTDEDDWRREAMGVWDKPPAERDAVIPLDVWKNLEIPDADVPEGNPDRYALTMSPDRVASIAVAVKGEKSYVDLAELDRVDDSRKLIDWLVSRCKRRIPVMIDSRDPAASFVNELRSRGVKVNVTTQSDAGRACGGLLDAVNEERVTHCGQPAIRAGLQAAEKKDIRGKPGVWEWNLDDPTPEVAALRALTLAHYGLSFEKKRTGKGRRVVTA